MEVACLLTKPYTKQFLSVTINKANSDACEFRFLEARLDETTAVNLDAMSRNASTGNEVKI